jgi:hypothetical protein
MRRKAYFSLVNSDTMLLSSSPKYYLTTTTQFLKLKHEEYIGYDFLPTEGIK